MIDERIAERRAEVREQRRRSRLRRTVTLAVLLVVAVVLVVVERSPLVGLEEVLVTGTERLDAADVRRAAALELGTSTLRLGLGEAAARVEALPLVEHAAARRRDPLTVVIEVVERQPVLNVTGGDGRGRLVDREGVVLLEGGLDELPEIRLGHEPPEPGASVDRDPALANAHRAWRGLSGPLRSRVGVYRAAGPEELVLELRDGPEVRFGRAERIDEKVRALGAVLADLGDTEVGAIDVRAPSTPVVVGRQAQG